MNRKELADLLSEAALYLELAEANPFKARAYSQAARAILKAELLEYELTDPDRLTQIKGIGKGLAEAIIAAAQTGRLPALDELKAKVAPGLVEMTRVPGLGPKKVLALHKELGLSSLGELAYAVNENRLVELKGFGAKTQAKIKDGIEFLKSGQDRFLYPEAALVAARAVDYMKELAQVKFLEVVGPLRRLGETVERVKLLAASLAPQACLTHFSTWVRGAPQERTSADRMAIHHPDGPWVELSVVEPSAWIAALVLATGSTEHTDRLAAIARDKGLELTDQGLLDNGRPLNLAAEADLYAALGLAFVPPELREGRDELDLAAAGRLPRLVEAADLKGLMHIHTTASDGGGSLREMAEAAIELGYGYFGLTDHSQSAFYAGGLKAGDLARQRREVEKLNAELAPFRIFRGVESDIRTDGSLDYPDEILDRLDFVIASVHSNFGLDEEKQTARLVRAVGRPQTTILGHPTGRLLLARRAYALDLDRVMAACAEAGVAPEINAHPQRLDTDWRDIAAARMAGLELNYAICPDAHRTDGLTDAVFGVNVARKGGLTRDRVLNCLDADQMADYLAQRKAAHAE